MTGKILTSISTPLYKKICEEKKKLQSKEEKKVKSRRKKITMVIASNSLARRL